MCVYGFVLVVEVELRMGFRKGDVRLVETSYSSDVLPVPVEDVGEDFFFFYCLRNDLFTEVPEFVVERFFHRIGVKNVYSHGRKIFLSLGKLFSLCFGDF